MTSKNITIFTVGTLVLITVIISFNYRTTPSRIISPPKNEMFELRQIYIASGEENDVFSTKNKKIFSNQTANYYLTVVGEAVINDKIYYLVDRKIKLKKLIISNRLIPRKLIINWPNESLNIRWYQIQSEKGSYRNGSGEGWWAKIKYETKEIKGARDLKTIPLNSVFSKKYGTKRFQAKVITARDTLSTPGSESTRKYGISDMVHRITIFEDSTLVGLIKGFFGIPYIWGSASPTGKPHDHQAEKFIGADCADLITAAARLKGINIPYTSSAGLRKYAQIIAKQIKPRLLLYYDKNGDVISTQTIKPDDLLLFNGHVAVFVKDRFIKGKLDVFDLMIDTAGAPPSIRPILIGTIGWGNFDIGRLK